MHKTPLQHRQEICDNIQKAFGADELQKGGEGSKGGNVIGHTKSGKPIYEHDDPHSKEAMSHYKDFSSSEHKQAEKMWKKKYDDTLEERDNDKEYQKKFKQNNYDIPEHKAYLKKFENAEEHQSAHAAMRTNKEAAAKHGDKTDDELRKRLTHHHAMAAHHADTGSNGKFEYHEGKGRVYAAALESRGIDSEKDEKINKMHEENGVDVEDAQVYDDKKLKKYVKEHGEDHKTWDK